jgi:heat shock protein HtpX
MGATAKTLLLMGVLTGLLGALGYIFLGGLAGLVVFVVLAAIMNFFAYWFSDKLALRMAGAHEVTPEQAPRLHGIVDEMTSITKLPKPKVYLIQNPSPNAFATGRNPKHAVVAATTGIMDLLDDRELRGVMAHELGHVGNRDILIGSIAAVIAGAISWITTSMMWGMMFGRRGEGNGLLALAAIILMPMAAAIVQMSISRTREYQADRMHWLTRWRNSSRGL